MSNCELLYGDLIYRGHGTEVTCPARLAPPRSWEAFANHSYHDSHRLPRHEPNDSWPPTIFAVDNASHGLAVDCKTAAWPASGHYLKYLRTSRSHVRHGRFMARQSEASPQGYSFCQPESHPHTDDQAHGALLFCRSPGNPC